MTKSKPVHRIRLGVIAASIFANKADGTTHFDVQINRDSEVGEQSNHTTSFGRDDLLNVSKAADLAHSWIQAQQQGKEGDQPSHSLLVPTEDWLKPSTVASIRLDMHKGQRIERRLANSL